MASVTIHVFRGSRPELLPAMCMFCGQPLEEERFARLRVQIGNQEETLLELPICHDDRLPVENLTPDSRSHLLDAMGGIAPTSGLALMIGVTAGIAGYMARSQETVQATFTFEHAHRKFVRELDRLRNLTANEYEDMMAEANKAFLAKLHANTKTGDPTGQKEQQLAEDEAQFGLEKTVGTGEATAEVTTASSNKMLLMGLIAGAISVLLVACVTAAFVGYAIVNRKPEADPDIVKNKQPPAAAEAMGKITAIDRDARTIRLIMFNETRQTYRVTDKTEFFDRDGNRFPEGMDDPGLRVNDYCVILPTDDRQKLRWLKLSPPPAK